MRSLISVLLLVLALSACDNELKLISRDFPFPSKALTGARQRLARR